MHLHTRTSRIVLVRARSCVSPHRRDSGTIRSRNNGGQGRETDAHSEHSYSYLCAVCVWGSAYWSRAQCLYYTLHCFVSSIMLLYVNTPTTLWANETFYVRISKLWKNTSLHVLPRFEKRSKTCCGNDPGTPCNKHWGMKVLHVRISKLWKNTMIGSHHASLTSVLQMTNAWVGSLGYGWGLVLTVSVTE